MYLESGIVFLNDTIRFCCVPRGNSVIAPLGGPEMDVGHFLNFREQTAKAPLADCLKCVHFLPDFPKDFQKNKKLTYINFGHGDYCNFKCEYCWTTAPGYTPMKPKYKMMPFLRQLEEYGLIDNNCMFFFDSGEPVLNPETDELLEFSKKYNGYCVIHSNCSIYSESAASVLAEGRGHIVCSVDAGTRDTFIKVRGADKMDAVTENLRRYAERGKVISKYIIYGLNCSRDEIIRYIKVMLSIGVKHIVLTLHAWVGVKDEFIECMALGKFLAQSAGIGVSASNDTSAVISKNIREFTEIFIREFPGILIDNKPKQMKWRPVLPTDGHIDYFEQNGENGCCIIEGWITDRYSKDVFETVTVKIGKLYYNATALQPRPDVAAHFGEPKYTFSGFSALIINPPPGEQTVEIIGLSKKKKMYASVHKITASFPALSQ
jgi:pyruvate-formate lyase-activating enzyme